MRGFYLVSASRLMGGLSVKRDNSPFVLDYSKRERQMIMAGFIIDPENDVYTKKRYGAIINNVDEEIKSLDDLINYRDPIFKTNPYLELLEDAKKTRNEISIRTWNAIQGWRKSYMPWFILF